MSQATEVLKFETNDPKARITWHGVAYRAVQVMTFSDQGDDLWVFLVRVTRKGADYKSGDGIWLTVENSLDIHDEGKALETYIRELTAPKAKAAPVVQRFPRTGTVIGAPAVLVGMIVDTEVGDRVDVCEITIGPSWVGFTRGNGVEAAVGRHDSVTVRGYFNP